MQAPLQKKIEMKVLILYLMDRIGYPLDYVQLNDICTADGLMTGFDFAECFGELCDVGNILCEGERYSITDRGRSVVSELEGLLLRQIRENTYKSAVRLLDFQKAGRSIEYSVGKNPDGKPTLSVSITNGENVIMSTTLAFETEDLLERALYRWNTNPEGVYRGITASLSGDIEYLQ